MTIRLVLLPGLDGSGVLFRPLLRSLPAEIEPIVISYPPDEPLGYNDLLPRIRAQLPTDGPYAVLGESFSGPLAIRIAAEHPPGLQAVILSASFVRSPLPFRPLWLSRFVHPWMFVGFRPASWLKTAVSRYSNPEVRSLIAEALAEVQFEVLSRRIRSVLRVDASEELAACTVPMLYLQGTADWIVPHHNTREISSIYPRLEVRTLPAPHLVMQTQPDQAAQAIAELLGVTPSTPDETAS